jgi:serine/threonine-protein kinase
MARVGTPLPPHPALGPLDEVLARAAAPEASARLDAAGFAARLGALASALPTPEPLPLRSPNHEETAPIAGFRAPGVTELTEIPGAVGGPKAPVGTKAGPGEIFDAEPLGATSVKPMGLGGPAIAAPPTRNRKRLWIIAAAVVVLALIAGGLVALESNVFTPSHKLKNLVGLTMAQAQAAAARDHFTLRVEPGVKSTTIRTPGSIVSQSPKVGTSLKEGSTISVVPSIGPPSVAVPSFGTMNCTAAAVALHAANLSGTCAAPQYSATVPNGQILSWSYPGSVTNPTTAPYGSLITMVPSEGHAPVTVPPIPTGYTFAQAAAAIEAVGLTATQVNQTSTTVAQGLVISTAPASGAPAPYGSSVTVTVSSGPPMVTVPPVAGDTVAVATNALTAANLTVSGVTGNPNGTVRGTSPAAGQSVPPGTAVQILTR